MKRIFSLLFCAAALCGAISCDSEGLTDNDVLTPEEDNNDGSGSDPDVEPDTTITLPYLYVLNGGSYGSNNATLSSYDYSSEESVDCIFAAQNGQGLGDTAQDMLVFGDQIFITVYGSGIIFVTDLEGKLVEQIVDDTYTLPRCLATDGDFVYVSYYDGGVAKINPMTYALTKAEASINPEKLVVANDNVYVTISQGYGNYNDCNTIDVYDASTMTYTKSIEVVLNPTAIEVDSEGNLYVLSMGNYGYGDIAIYATLQKIDGESEESTILSLSGIEGATPSAMTMGADDVLYVVEGVTDPSTWTMTAEVYAYDTTTGDVTTFITDDTTIDNTYSISADMTSGEVYVGTSDYTNTGDIYVLNSDGTLKSVVAAGLNPMKAIKVALEVE